MTIKLFCCFYNEEFLIPYFLSHYRWVDSIEALVSPSTDNTLRLLAQEPRVVINPVEFPDGKFDDQFKTRAINRAINESPFDADWHMVVDADEFVWPTGRPDACRSEVNDVLNAAGDVNAILARMWVVFRHHTDSDLDASKPPALQRRHGISNPNAIEFKNGIKPVFTRPGKGLQYTVGQHQITDLAGDYEPAKLLFDGAHWTNADPCFCVERRVKNRSPRLSGANHSLGLGYHNFQLTEQQVREECARHLNDPECF